MTKTFLGGILAVLSLSLPSAYADTSMTSKAWVDAFSMAFPNAACKPRSYFRECFRIDEDECIRETARATKTCVIKFEDKMPPNLNSTDKGAWGNKIGGCAGGTFEVQMRAEKKKVDSAECADASSWVPR